MKRIDWQDIRRFAGLAFLFLLVCAMRGESEILPPVGLECDALVNPLGIDSPHPMLSWRLQDGRWGARQTAYRVMVYSKASGKHPDVWDSGKVLGDTSTGVPYTGPALEASTRYFWRVEVWDVDEKQYPLSAPGWWETGLMSQDSWKANWIGYEDAELQTIRKSGATWITNKADKEEAAADTHHDFRFHFAVDRTVTSAVLFATGEDTAAAWVNGQQILEATPRLAWGQMPWGTYTRRDVTQAVQQGDNLLAIGVTKYIGGGRTAPTHTPMSMCLYLVFADGSTRLFSSASREWKAMLDAPEGWWKAGYNDGGWTSAERFVVAPGDFSNNGGGLPWPTGPVAALRHEFSDAKAVVSARLYATALGAYTARINGQKVGDQLLAPGWMDYRERVPYQVYDVTAMLRPGKNAIAAYLAPGWYSTPLRWFRQGNNYGATQPAFRAQLRLEHADGTVDWIATDASWKVGPSAILEAEIYDGETMDARMIAAGWDAPGFADSAWKQAQIVAPKEPMIVAQDYQPIREEKVLTRTAVTQPRPGVYVLDFGQNMSALPRLRVRGRRGDDIQLRFAEVLNADGTLYVENLRNAKATDHFILSGSKPAMEEYQPQFTFHGFRYAEITGLRSAPTAETLKAVVLHTAAPFSTRLTTGDPMVNQLWSNILWGQRSNFVGVPTDCPQRDERLGWSADAQVFWRTATYNMDLATFSRKYAADLHGTQVGTAMYGIYAPGVDTPNAGYGAAWSDAGVIVPWTGWIQSGNRRIVDENWDGMKDYVAEIAKNNPDHLWRRGLGAPFGDWLTPTVTTPEDLIATAYWAYDLTLMKQMARATGREVEADRYDKEFRAVKAAFLKAYVRDDGFVGVVDRFPSIPPPTIRPEDAKADPAKPVETQTGYVLALYMDLLPPSLRASAAARLVRKIEENHWLLGTGFLGTPYLLEVLSDAGYADVAYRLLLNRAYPSWGYLIEHGATTTWERWNGDQMRGDPSMNSYNHYAYGAVGEWIYRYAAGIDTLGADAGFRTILLHPNFDARLGHLDFEYDSPYGLIRSDWKVVGDQVTWRVTVPPNAKASLPLGMLNVTHFMIDGEPIGQSNMVNPDGEQKFSLPSGSYSFSATLTERKRETHPKP